MGEPSGFCIFNHAAAAAIHALQRYPEIKVSMLDWDVHYGQGVADIMQRHGRARYVSLHQVDIYPFPTQKLMTGQKLETFGEHQNILTVPVDPSSTWSAGYEQVFTEQALPFIRSDEWDPDLVIICCGFDALESEQLADVSLSAPDYGLMTHALREHLSRDRERPPGLMFGLDGGYQIADQCEGGNLSDALVETVKVLVDDGKATEGTAQ